MARGGTARSKDAGAAGAGAGATGAGAAGAQRAGAVTGPTDQRETTPTTMSMAAALNRALADSLAADDRVVVFGEDVGALGGVFRITDGLTERFGESRCFDTPLAESGIVGTAVGMAMNGMTPVVEMQFDAFALPAFEQVVSHVAKLGNRTRGDLRMPLVIRIPYGGGIGGVEHHCDSSEAYYAHTPGLTVVSPSTPQDAYSLLRAAIASPDPVIFMEPKKLYWSTGPVDTSIEAELRRARVVRPGSDLTLIGYGPSVPIALEAAEAAEADGRSVEVIDVRTLTPFDDRTVVESVRRTGRAIVIAEAPGFASVASEIQARVFEQCFEYLEAPVRRVTGFDTPFASPKFEHWYLPDAERVLDAIETLHWEESR
ncbi:alpha-ketoacid dehydrogenase subunit beta [Leucobacter chromiiresistens]